MTKNPTQSQSIWQNTRLLLKKSTLLLFLFTAISFVAAAQKVVTGVVKDSNGAGMPGVGVKVKGTSNSTITASDGKYSLKVDDDQAILLFTYMGFKVQELPLRNQSTLNATLDEEVTTFKEVVITGYGSQSRETLTTAISKLNPKTLENIPYTNALSALQGSVAGVRVQSVTGQPGQAPRVVLRGGTSLNNVGASAAVTANSPLYLVDGVIRTNLADIAADDIESMQILKDAASTSIYGSRASNGVILVTTKSGKAGTTKISYTYDITSADDGNRNLDYVGAADYVYYARQANVWAIPKIGLSAIQVRLALPAGWGTGNDLTKNTAFTTQYLTPANAYKLNEGWQSVIDPLDPTKTIIFDETDFQKISMQRALSQNHYISVAGGTEKAKFNAGLGYLLANGTAINSDYNRLTANLNSSLQVTDKLQITGRLLFASTDFLLVTPETNASGQLSSTGGNLSNVFYRSASMPSTAKYQFEDGTIAPGLNNSLGNPDYYQRGPFSPQRKNRGEKVTVSINGKWNILPGLSFDPLISYFKDEQFGRSFQPTFLSGITTLNSTRTASQYQNNTTNLQGDGVLTYAKTFGGHSFEAKAGYTYFKRNAWNIAANGDGAATDNVLTINGVGVPRQPGGQENEFVTEGVFGRINYDYNQKYLLMLTARRDGASNLGSANRYAFFPGVGLGWNVHKEKFWSMMPKQISNFKIRATYGENGRIEVLSDYGWQGTYSVGNTYGGAAAVITNELPNPDLKWEQSKTFDVGLDLGLFNNRLSLAFDYFDRKTDQLLAQVILPTSSGFSTVSTNNGSLGNKGLEIDLNLNVFPQQKAFQWNVNFNAAKVTTKVLKLPNNGVLGNRQGGLEVWDPVLKAYIWKAGSIAGSTTNFIQSFIEGSRPGDMYAYKQIGIYATDADAANAPFDTGATFDFNSTIKKTKFGGDVIWADLDGNNIIDSRDQVYVGNFYPTWTGGFSNYFTYKNFGFTIRTDFATGHTIFNYGRAFADGQLQGDLLPTQSFIDKSWKKQGDITNTPRYVHQSNVNISRNSTYYEKGDFLAIREITLSYSLPSSIARKIKLGNVRFNLTGNNLHYFTNYQGANPEEGGPDNGRYPNARGITFGANIGF
ncbi:MAG: TonB-dependent receptor [Opitutaceae bacterium]|nr:TonB-dependent receptor [Cytophagales bacterium]